MGAGGGGRYGQVMCGSGGGVVVYRCSNGGRMSSGRVLVDSRMDSACRCASEAERWYRVRWIMLFLSGPVASRRMSPRAIVPSRPVDSCISG